MSWLRNPCPPRELGTAAAVMIWHLLSARPDCKSLIPLLRCALYLIAMVLLVGGIAFGYYMGKSSVQGELSSVQSQLDKAQRANFDRTKY